MPKKQTTVKFFHVGDADYKGSTLFVAESKRQAMTYIRDWLDAHSTKTYPYKKVSSDRWESKFSAIYFE